MVALELNYSKCVINTGNIGLGAEQVQEQVQEQLQDHVQVKEQEQVQLLHLQGAI